MDLTILIRLGFSKALGSYHDINTSIELDNMKIFTQFYLNKTLGNKNSM